MISKDIFTIWLNDKQGIPEDYQKCIESQKLPGYTHRILTLEDCPKGIRYLDECLEAKKWVKASDYLRAWWILNHGGIYLDADCEVLKPLDIFLDNEMFAGEEVNRFICNAVFGAIPGHPILKEYCRRLEDNFRGSGDMVFEPGILMWTECLTWRPVGNIKIYPPEYFYPYHHINRTENFTENTHILHKYLKSWAKV